MSEEQDYADGDPAARPPLLAVAFYVVAMLSLLASGYLAYRALRMLIHVAVG